MHLRARPSLHDMWSRGEHKQPRIHHSHHISLRDRLQIRSKHPKAEVQNAETTKAVAWAVFQHHGGGDGRGNSGHFHSHSSMAVRRPTRFKIEAQMKQEITHRSFMPEVVAIRWDAGSTLFDSFELDSLLKTLDQATHPGDHESEEDEAGALVLYSPKKEIPQTRFLAEDDDNDDDDSVFTPKQSFKPAKEVSHNSMWKSLLHSLHLDGAMFHGLQKLQSQVAPHDSKLEHKGRTHKANGGHRHGHSTHVDVAQFDALFERNNLHVSKDGGHHQPHLWKLSFKAPVQGHNKGHDLQDQAWAAAFPGNLHEQSGVPHHHHHHYHHHDEGEDYEMTVQAISRRVARTSFEEKLRTRRVSIELEAPRNSLDIDAAERVAIQPKARSVWDAFEL